MKDITFLALTAILSTVLGCSSRKISKRRTPVLKKLKVELQKQWITQPKVTQLIQRHKVNPLKNVGKFHLLGISVGSDG